MAYARIRIRRGTLAEWSATNPVLASGELVIEVPDTGVGTGYSKFKIGDGYKQYMDLPYAFDGGAASAIYGGTVYAWNNIYMRSGTTVEWLDSDPVIGLGEVVFDSTKMMIKVGDGKHKWSELKYFGGFDIEDEFDFGDEDE